MRRTALGLGVCAILASYAFGQATGGAQPNTKVIGKLGQAINTSKIYAGMNTNARVYWTVKPNEYIVVNPVANNDKWLSVILKNGSIGYILTADVASLPYDVRIPVTQNLQQTTTAGRSSIQDVQGMLNFSYQFVGTPYKWGGNSLTGGIDCSAFVQQVFRRRGINLPRTAAEQAKVGRPVERLEHLQAGDRLYFWDKRRNMIGHCGIFMGFHSDGGAYFIHSSSNNRGIDTDDLRNQKWRDTLVGARRD